VKHILIILSLLLLSSPLYGNSKKGETLYLWETSCCFVWKGFGDKEKHPIYKGDVENGVPNGVGLVIYPDGSKYEGEYNDEEKNGQGTETYPDGSKYVGEWKDNDRNGQGTYTLLDGTKYVGEWENGKYHGQGTYTLPEGLKYVGEWESRSRNIHFTRGTQVCWRIQRWISEWSRN